MKVRTSGMRGVALLALGTLAFAACDRKTPIAPVVPPEITVSVVPSTMSLQVGQTGTFIAVVSNTTNTAVTWSSSAPAVATVSASGVVTAVAPGSATIIAVSSADPNRQSAGVVTVTEAPGTEVTLQLVPAEATIAIGGTVQLVSVVTGTDNTAVTYASSTPAVATVDASGLVTGVAQGTAVITATSQADPTKIRTATITVTPAAPPPSISIANVTGVGANNVVSGQITATINVSADVSHDVRSVHILLRGIEVCTQTFAQPLGTTQGVATITCNINTNAVDEDGVPLFPNGTAELTAEARNGAGETVAEASYGNLNIQNANVVNFEITTEGVTSDGSAIGSDGLLWHEGNVVVTARPAIFTGASATSVNICINIPVGTDAPGSATGTSCRLISTSTANAFVATFPKAQAVGAGGAAGPGVQNVSNSNVRAYVTASTLSTGQPGPTAPLVAGSPSIRLDNLAPTAVVALPEFVTDPGHALFSENYLRATFNFTSITGVATANTTATATEVADPQPGVGNTTVTFHVVPASEAGANNAANNLAIVNDGQQVTSATELESSLTNTFYVVVAAVVDGLGNRFIARAPSFFGVDLVAPTIEVVAAQSPPADAINPADMTIQVRVTDEFSGATGVQGMTIGHSVFEINTNTAVEQRCYELDGTFSHLIAANDPCVASMITVPVATVGAVEFYDVTIPAAENFYVLTIQSRDAAGNLSETTITRQALIDMTGGPTAAIAAVTIANFTIDNVNNTATVNGTIRDNIDIDEYDARFVFPGLTSANAVALPNAVPFTTPTDVGSYGLPLTAVANVSATTQVNVVGIVDDPADGAADYTVSMFGFGVRDIAQNFVFGGIPVTPAAFTPFAATFQMFELESAHPTIDRTPTAPAVGSTTLTAIATTDVGAANPVARVYFYYVNPGSDLVYGTADDHNVLIGSTASATVLTGETVREFRFTQTLAATSLPANVAGFDFRVFAIGVDASGSAVISNAVEIEVLN
jgi:hypothetical protein